MRGKRLLFAFWLTCGVLLPLSVIRPETSSASKLLTSLSLLGLLTIPITLLLPHRRLRALARRPTSGAVRTTAASTAAASCAGA